MKRLIWLVLALGFACCAKNSAPSSQLNSQRTVAELTSLAQQKAKLAAQAKRSNMKTLAEEGVAASNECLAHAPEEAACYYWRAVNTGLYYQAHIIGYQTGVKQMIADAHKAITLDAHYQHAGAYRLLGELYSQLPETSSRTDNIVRDLDKAETYFQKAFALAPQYAENAKNLAKIQQQKE